jgi:3D (Asp-Asp-Asp) domain-containing protein
MRHSHTARGLTAFDRWDLGALLALLTVICMLLAGGRKPQSVPPMFAEARLTEANNLVQRTIGPSYSTAQPVAPQRVLMSQPQVISTAASVPPSTRVATTVTAPTKKSFTAPGCQWFNGKRYRYWKTLHMRVTAYAADPRCCWPFDGTTTASGLSVKTNHGHLVAADTRVIPMHALVSVPGYQRAAPVPVLDRGSAIKGPRLDVLLPSFAQAQKWGVKNVDVKVYLPVDE